MKITPTVALLNKREQKEVFRLLGLLEEYIERALESHITPGTGSIFNGEVRPEDRTWVRKVRLDWRKAENLRIALEKRPRR
jgi:hypothetical protein